MSERALWALTVFNLAALAALGWAIEAGRAHRDARLDQRRDWVDAQHDRAAKQHAAAAGFVDALERAGPVNTFDPAIWRWNAGQLDANRCREAASPCGLLWIDEDAKAVSADRSLRSLGWQLRWPVAHGVDALAALRSLDLALGAVRLSRCGVQRVGSILWLDCTGRVFGMVAP
ncbi:MAG: hypothetical protein AAGA11_11910 [Pseudomonadota bacterium]